MIDELRLYRISSGIPESNGYLYIEANGGLNQQRTSVCPSVPKIIVIEMLKFCLGKSGTLRSLILLLCIQICNAVAVAGFLNATLVIPHFHFHSIWRDPRLAAVSSASFVRVIQSFHSRTFVCYILKNLVDA